RPVLAGAGPLHRVGRTATQGPAGLRRPTRDGCGGGDRMARRTLHLVRGRAPPATDRPPPRRRCRPGQPPAAPTVRGTVTGSPYASGVAELNPQQRDVRDELLLYGQPRPTPDRDVGKALRQRAIHELTALAGGLDPADWIRVDKHRLSQAHTCTGYLRAR